MNIREHLLEGHVIPALPLALTRQRRWDERRQKALLRYYMDAGAGGIAVGVHSTQFAIRDKSINLFNPVLELASKEITSWFGNKNKPFIKIAGICGKTRQAVREAELATRLSFQAGLLSLSAWQKESEKEILEHCRNVARKIPLLGFYLQTAVGGRTFSYSFWRKFAEIPELVGIKIAPFNRYQTLDVVRAVCEADRGDVALYTGNDDHIILDLLTPFQFAGKTRHIVGGLLGQWGVGTQKAVQMLQAIKKARTGKRVDQTWLQKDASLTDMNAAIFDATNRFAGCLPGIHEVLRRQGLLSTTACLDPKEKLSPGQADEITRVFKAYPWLSDDAFVAKHLEHWFS